MDVSVTLTEGMWAKDMALAIENKTGISNDKLLKLWSDEKFVKNLIEKYEVLTKDIINKDVKVLLKGIYIQIPINLDMIQVQKRLLTKY